MKPFFRILRQAKNGFKLIEKLLYIFYHKSGGREMETEVFQNLLQQLPGFVQEQVLSYKRWQERQQAVIGKHLLLYGLQSFHPVPCSLDQLKYTEYKKPYFEGKLHFNISHADAFTVCVISETTSVGIDIEKVHHIHLADFESQFSGSEFRVLLQAKNQASAFFKLWTQKEAFVKLVGTGLHFPLNEIKIENGTVRYNDQDWFLHEIPLHPEYVCHLCTTASSPAIIIREVHF